MLGRLLLLFILVPLVELVLLLWLADLTGWQFTLLFVIVTGATGVWLVRRQGFRTWRRITEEFAASTLPAEALWDAAMILVAGALLLTPGVLTDLVGLSLLIPPCRRWYRRRLVRWFTAHTTVHYRSAGTSAEPRNTPEIIDSYVVRREEESG